MLDHKESAAMRGVWVVIATLLIAGCGRSDRASVSGQILQHDGQPLARATVTARSSETGNWASGFTDAEGRFVLGTSTPGDGLPPGDYQVTIREDRGDDDNPSPRTISEKYASPTASGLTLSVQAGQRATFDVTLDPL